MTNTLMPLENVGIYVPEDFEDLIDFTFKDIYQGVEGTEWENDVDIDGYLERLKKDLNPMIKKKFRRKGKWSKMYVHTGKSLLFGELNKLTKYLLANFYDEIKDGEKDVDVAIRLLKQYKKGK